MEECDRAVQMLQTLSGEEISSAIKVGFGIVQTRRQQVGNALGDACGSVEGVDRLQKRSCTPREQERRQQERTLKSPARSAQNTGLRRGQARTVVDPSLVRVTVVERQVT